MKHLHVALLSVACGSLLVTDYSSHSSSSGISEEVTLTTGIDLFGTRTFTSVFINSFGSVSFDKEAGGVDSTSQTLQPADPKKIIIAPYMAVVASGRYYYSQTPSSSSETAINDLINAQTGLSTYASTYNLVVTWEDQTLSSAPSSPLQNFQLVITTNTYKTFAVFIFDTGASGWATAIDENGGRVISGFLAHDAHLALCLKTAVGPDDFEVDATTTIWNLADQLACTNSESFTSCGSFTDSLNVQFTSQLGYKTTSSSSGLGHVYTSEVTCNDGFAVDASGNKRYPADCVYDPDMYEEFWDIRMNPNTGSEYECKQVTSKLVQIKAVSIATTALDGTPFDFLNRIYFPKLNRDMKRLWLLLFKFVVKGNISTSMGISSSMRINAITLVSGGAGRRRRSNNVRVRRVVTDPSGVDITALLDELSVWMDTSSFTSFNDIQDAIIAAAGNADALDVADPIASVDVTVGVDQTTISETDVKEMMVLVLRSITDITVDNSTLADFVPDILAQVITELALVTADSSCLNKGSVPSVANPNWIRPDGCCLAKPINSGIHGCCELTSGGSRYFSLSTQQCCLGAIINATTDCTALVSAPIDVL